MQNDTNIKHAIFCLTAKTTNKRKNGRVKKKNQEVQLSTKSPNSLQDTYFPFVSWKITPAAKDATLICSHYLQALEAREQCRDITARCSMQGKGTALLLALLCFNPQNKKTITKKIKTLIPNNWINTNHNRHDQLKSPKETGVN